jgi:tellurite resistance protein TerC
VNAGGACFASAALKEKRPPRATVAPSASVVFRTSARNSRIAGKLRIVRWFAACRRYPGQAILASASASPAGWAALVIAVLGLLAFDLFFAHRGDDRISLRRAAGWSALWMVVGVAFGLVVLALLGSSAAGSYWAGFLMEKALSLDNVFVIAVLLGTFAVPQALKADVLTFGIAVALMLRTVFIVAGVTLLEIFHPAIYAMGALLIFTGLRLAIQDDGGQDFAEGRTMRALRRVLPMGAEFHGRRIFAREHGSLLATPLLAALLAVALADVIFAIDSIPAVLAITTDTFLIFAANAFALLGLRALYFLLDGMAQKFEYLHYGLGALLVFVGAKMLVEDAAGHLPVGVSLAVIVAVLAASVGASLLLSSKRSTTAV